MLWLLWSSAIASIHSTRNEMAGLAYVKEISVYIEAAQKLRTAASQSGSYPSDAKSNLARALENVRQQQRGLGTPEVTAETFSELEALHNKVVQGPAEVKPETAFALTTELIDKALSLNLGVADASAMTLDPIMDTYHLINLAVILGPQELEYLTRLRDLSKLILEPADGKEPSPKSFKAAERAISLITVQDEAYEASYKRAIEGAPEFAATLDMDGADRARETMLTTVEKQVLSGIPSGDPKTIQSLSDAGIAGQVRLNQGILQRLEARLDERIRDLQRAMALELTLSLLSISIALYMMLAFYKVMRGGLREVAGHLEQITQGNLTVAPKPWGSDEAAELMTTMGAMQTSLRRIAQAVLESAEGVKTASDEIAAASQNLATRTENSAQDIQQTSHNMATIADNVKHTATMVAGTTAIVSENAHAAGRGAQVIRQVVHTMEDIRRSSNQIGEIISVIDGIAFQTNILALNAAVEAARAGEQGRGFAVVASEVRALAGRSAEAAKEIKRLISDSIAQVETGNQVVKESGDTIEVIVVNADQVNALMKEISQATQEQTEGVTSVENAVHSLDQNTQQNATLVEETAASATALAEQAQRLADEVAFFKLK